MIDPITRRNQSTTQFVAGLKALAKPKPSRKLTMANLDKLTFVLDAKMTGLEQTLSRADRQIRSFADNADKSNQLAARLSIC